MNGKQFFLYDKETDSELQAVKREIVLSMNGVVSGHFEDKGIRYRKNYGVSLPHLCDIAANHAKNHLLAQQLWALKVRETMILGILLQPTESFTRQLADNWVSDMETVEIADIACMKLFAKLPFAKQKVAEWINAPEDFKHYCGFLTAAHCVNQLAGEEILLLKEKAFAHADKQNCYRAATVFLKKLVADKPEWIPQIQHGIAVFEHADSPMQRYFFEEITTQIKYQ